jgi:phage terminase large subunit
MAENKTVKFSEMVNFSTKQKIATETADKNKFTLYGGAMGGGKSYWLRWYCLRWLVKTYKETQIRGLTAALFCEDYPTLKDRHLGKLAIEVPEWLGSLKEDKAYGLCVKLDKAFGEGILLLRNLDDPAKYASSEFGLVAVDELTRDERSVFDLLRTRMRWPGLEDTKFVAGTNPGSIGHDWVKKLWIDRFFDDGEKEADQFAYVKATAKDNPFISSSYLRSLDSLPEKMRRAFLEGDWDIFEGQFFTEFNREKHVVKTIARDKLPAHWPNFRSIDVSGRNGITSCHWYTLDGDGTVWVYREYYWTGRDSDQHAEEIWKMSREWDGETPKNDEGYRYSVMDNSAWAKMGLPETTVEVYLRKWAELDNQYGVESSHTLEPSEKHRVMRWDIVHQYLRWDDKTDPRLKIMDNCPNMIRTLPVLIHDEKNKDDINTDGEDHAADELGYLLQTLRDQKTPAAESSLARRMREMKEAAEQENFNYSYTRHS